MIQRLGSLRLAFYNILVLVLLLGTGALLSLSFKEAFLLMNELGIAQWLTEHAVAFPWVFFWFLAVCASAALLLVNAVCCCFDRQLSKARHSGKARQWLFFILHCFFILVLASHGLVLAVQEKKSRITLGRDESVLFGPWKVAVKEVVFADDPEILDVPKSKRRSLMTRENIHIPKNRVRVLVYEKARVAADKNLTMLDPLRYGPLQVTLVEFTKVSGTAHPKAVLNLTKNPLGLLFFWAYGFMIAAFFGYTLLTWKKNGKGFVFKTGFLGLC